MLVRIVGLTKSLLPSHLARTSVHAIWSWSSLARILSVGKHRAAIEQPLFFLLGTLFEEYLPQHILLLLVRVIILHVVVVGLVKDTIGVVIAVWVLISNPSSLTH